jgi:hypothetical protein
LRGFRLPSNARTQQSVAWGRLQLFVFSAVSYGGKNSLKITLHARADVAIEVGRDPLDVHVFFGALRC